MGIDSANQYMNGSAPSEPRRVWAFEGIHNFRDYGGYAVAGGGRLRGGLLYRSAHHGNATPADLAQLDALGLRAVVDLRGRSEREKMPCRRASGFSAQLYEVPEETGGLLGPLIEQARARPGGLDASWLMREGYATMPFRWRMKGILRNHFDALAAHGGPVLVHCMAGKDRTGLAVALLQDAMGVHRDDVMADFLLTNEAGNADLKGDGPNSIRVTFGGELTDEQVRELSAVRPEYLDAAMNAVRERHGGTAQYLRDALSIPEEWITAIRLRLIE